MLRLVYFEGGGVVIYAPVGRTETATMTKVWWHEVDDASSAIGAWALDLVTRWDDLKPRWAERMKTDQRGGRIQRPIERPRP
jgi:hypothetical protein